MASLTKHPKSQYWTACFAGRDGRQLKRSTKTADKREALQIALELERVEKQARHGTVTTAQLQKVLNDVSEKITGDSLIAPTVEAYLKEWMDGVTARNTEGTAERYGNTVRLFQVSLGAKSKAAITSIAPKDIEAFLNSRLKGGAAPKTAIVDLKTLNSAFRRAEAYGVILKNPVPAVRLPKESSTERDLFTHHEVERLLDATPTVEWQTLILLGYFIGARLSDCVHMRWERKVAPISATSSSLQYGSLP